LKLARRFELRAIWLLLRSAKGNVRQVLGFALKVLAFFEDFSELLLVSAGFLTVLLGLHGGLMLCFLVVSHLIKWGRLAAASIYVGVLRLIFNLWDNRSSVFVQEA